MKDKNIHWIYVVVRKSLKTKKWTKGLEQWELRDVDNPKWPKDLKTTLAFGSRRSAMRWVNYWVNGKDVFDVVAVRVDVSPIGMLVK